MPTECNYNVGAGALAETIYLLDSIATAATSGYSTRKLRAAYAGSCLRVRRSGDNAELDVGFASEMLDHATLLSFVDSGGGTKDGFVVTWYDQAGSARDITQATAGKQPQISDNGTLKIINSKPALEFTAANFDLLTNAVAISSYISASAYTVLGGIDINSFSGSGTVSAAGAIMVDTLGFWTPLGAGNVGGGDSVHTSEFSTTDETADLAATATNYVALSRYTGAALSIYLNGGIPNTDASAGNVGALTGLFQVGSFSASANFSFDGLTAELITYNVTLSTADINTLADGIGIIKGNMSSYNGATWTDI